MWQRVEFKISIRFKKFINYVSLFYFPFLVKSDKLLNFVEIFQCPDFLDRTWAATEYDELYLLNLVSKNILH